MEPTRFTVEDFNALLGTALPFSQLYGPEVLSITHGGARVRIPYREAFLRPGGTLNGPLVMALADLAAYAAVLGAVGNQPLAVTSQMNVSFLRKPAPAALVGEARMLKLGRKLAVLQVDVYSEGSPELVAHAVCTYALPSSMPRT